jgi:hypothetical protein
MWRTFFEMSYQARSSVESNSRGLRTSRLENPRDMGHPARPSQSQQTRKKVNRIFA